MASVGAADRPLDRRPAALVMTAGASCDAALGRGRFWDQPGRRAN